MAHIKQGGARSQFIRLPCQNTQFTQHQPPAIRHCATNHQAQQPHPHQQSGTYQFIPYSVNNQSVVIRQPVHQSFQDAHQNFVNNQQIHPSQQHHHHHQTNHNQQSTIMPPSYSPSHGIHGPATMSTSPYSNRVLSPFYEETTPLPSTSSGRCSIPLGSNDRPQSLDVMSFHSQPSSPYVSIDARVDHSYVQSMTPDYYNSGSVVSPSPLLHYDNTETLPAAISQPSPIAIIEEIAKALMRSAETLDPEPIKMPNIFSTRSSVDSADSMPDLESISDSQTLSDLLEIIERDIQEAYMQQHVPIIPVKHQKSKKASKNGSSVRELLETKSINFSVPSKRTGKKIQTKRFQCIVCKKQFAGGSHLKNHFKTQVHKNEVQISQMVDPVNMPPETWRVEEPAYPDDAALRKHVNQYHGGMVEGLQMQSHSQTQSTSVMPFQGPSVM